MSAIRALVLSISLAFLLVPTVSSAQADDSLEKVLIESGSTPADHQALAAHYRAKAAEAKQAAERHRKMTMWYGSKNPVAVKQSGHCKRIAAKFDELAKDFEELAAGHEAEAKAKP